MIRQDIEARVASITRFMEAVPALWPVLLTELDAIERDLTEALVTRDCPETRGRIKAIRAIKELPVALQAERDGLTEGLAE